MLICGSIVLPTTFSVHSWYRVLGGGEPEGGFFLNAAPAAPVYCARRGCLQGLCGDVAAIVQPVVPEDWDDQHAEWGSLFAGHPAPW